MDRIIFTSLAGLDAAMARQAINAGNIANANTPGFDADVAATGSIDVTGGGWMVSRKMPAAGEALTSRAPATLTATARPLDIALPEDLWMQATAADGSTGYTRRGDLRLDAEGRLVNGAGDRLAGSNGAIVIAGGAPSVDADGQVLLAGPDGAAIPVDRLQIVRHPAAQMTRRADGLFEPAQGEPEAVGTGANVRGGYLEGSNVNLHAALVDMIEQSRRYEMGVKLLATVRELAQRSTDLMRVE